MTFMLRCVIATAVDDDESAELIASLTAAIPYTRGRAFEQPFRGVIVGAYYYELLNAYGEDPSAFELEAEVDEDGDDAELEFAYMIPNRLPAASKAFPGKRFAYVDVECFGGTCFYSGEIVVDGEPVWQLQSLEQDGHQQLFAQLGLGEQRWYFPPFEREFLAGAAPTGALRRPIVGVIEGRVSALELERLAPILFVSLRDQWAVQPIGASTILLSAGDQDLALSINAGTDVNLIGGRSHVAHEVAAPLLAALAETLEDFDADFEVSLNSFSDRELVRRWSSRA